MDITRKAEILSSRALEVFVREQRKDKSENNTLKKTQNYYSNGLFELPHSTKNVHVHNEKSMELPTLHLDPEVAKELAELQKKGLDINKMLKHDPLSY